MRQQSRRVRVLVVPVLHVSCAYVQIARLGCYDFSHGMDMAMWLQICLQEYRSRVAYCIPILANASIAYDVSKRPTPEMIEKARTYRVCFVVSQVSSGFAVEQF